MEAQSRIFIDPVVPLPLLVLFAAILITLNIAIYLREQRSVGWRRWTIFTLFRVLGIAALFAILLNPQREVSEAPKRVNKKVILAIDHSQSMAHTDLDATSRIDEAKAIIEDADLIRQGSPVFGGLQLYSFSQSAVRLQANKLRQLEADEPDTRFHRSISSMLQSANSGSQTAGIILLTDGHDHELVNAARTALEARDRTSPLFAIPIGSARSIRDASLRIANYQPYIFAGQRARIDTAIRLIGCEYEDFTIELYREGKLLDKRRIAVGDELQRLESFEVIEEEPGQYAYEVRLSSVQNEVTTQNNRATTFLNVSNKRINILLLEGQPYWDTNFTQRESVSKKAAR